MSTRQPETQIKKVHIPWLMYMLIGFSAFLVIGAMAYILQQLDNIHRTHDPIHINISAIEFKVTKAHLWFEEILSNDRHEKIGIVRELLDQAERLIQGCIRGDRDEAHRSYGAPDIHEGHRLFHLFHDHHFRFTIKKSMEEIEVKFDEFRDSLEQRYRSWQMSGPGTNIDQRFDSIYTELMEETGDVKKIIRVSKEQHLNDYRAVQISLIFICLVLALFVATILYRFERRRAKDLWTVQRSEEALRKSEKKHETLVQNIPGMVYSTNPDWSMSIVSGCEEISGYTNKEFNSEKQKWINIIHPDDKERFFEEVSELVKQPKDLIQTYSIMTKSGNVSWVEDHKTSFFSDNGDFLGVDGIVLDVNKRKKAEAALKESEMKYRQLFNTVSDAIMVFDEETKVFVDVNEAALQRYGYSKEDFLQLEQPDIKAELEESQKIIHQALDGEITKIPLYYHKRSDETVFPVEISSGWFELGNRKLVCDIIRDITVRKRAEEEIQLNEARLEAMLKLSQLTQITTGEIAGFALEESARLTQSKIGFINFLSENEKYVTHAVYTKETLKQCKLPINLSAFEIDDCGLWSEAYRQRKPIIVNDYTAEHPSKSGYSDGHLQLKRFMSIPIFEGDRVVAVAALGNKQKKYNPGDVRQFRLFMEGLWQAMQRQKAQDSLRERERELTLRNKISEVFLTASGDEIYTKIIDLVLDVMESKKGYFGYIDQNGDLVCPSLTKDIWDKCMISDKNIVFHRETWGGLWGRSLLEKRTIYSNDSFKLPEGHVHLHNALATPLIHHDRLIGQLAVANKMTDYTDEDSKLLEMIALKVAPILKTMLDDQRYKSEKEKLENELRQSQKMEAIGTLAGGIAHDFNNILSAIVGYSEMALGHIAGNSRVRQHIGQVLKAGLRAKDLVKQILAISCHGKPERKPVQIQLIIKEALKLLRASLPTTIEIRQNIPTESGHVLAEPTQIHQVMMNLCTNALHAMQDKGGILKVKLASVKIGARNTAYPDLEPGPYLKLSVGDTGYGMDEDTMKRIFDPYFTTKEKDVGTGMGLAVVHGIVNNHGGTITVHSKIGEGSTFHVLLPQVEKEIGYEIESVAPLPTGNRRILFVDDEKALADLGKHMLEDLGYKVDIRVSSIEALELFKVRPHRFDLVITDMTMPNMTGDKLAGKLMAISPDIPIILCTGYSEKITEKKAKAMGIKEFLLKPLEMSDLSNAISRVLDER